jgi:hypothetical protein
MHLRTAHRCTTTDCGGSGGPRTHKKTVAPVFRIGKRPGDIFRFFNCHGWEIAVSAVLRELVPHPAQGPTQRYAQTGQGIAAKGRAMPSTCEATRDERVRFDLTEGED